ncbi:MAG: acyl-CoA/acyl-ACP dehydrogenase [Paludisphaera borealis]|uniref:acyl-CoA dehydrogenase family protein n=1 Tax=Paludisphaera borealis TaxID=1387353 RepID=UPI00283E40B9|nr:acyl-CoA dehydrogenase family protein [Paludisphaera borealis]MDR3619369.1 acyl-CoA/acyl-ACP dehydrogenase [Paludisphaera borealis]
MNNDVISWTEPESEESAIVDVTQALRAADGSADIAGEWPETLWGLLVDAGATRWSIPTEFGGGECPRPLLVQRYARLAEASLTAVFILSQHDAAIRRLTGSADRPTARRWLSAIADGAVATVGISQLTTSRRLGAKALVATEIGGGRYRLDGGMPWVTAAERADVIVTGAFLDDDRQVLLALPTDLPGVVVKPAFDLAALQASRTAEVVVSGVEIDESDILFGPSTEISSQPGVVGTAGLETSALALGQSAAAIGGLAAALALGRDDLAEPLDVLSESWRQSWDLLMTCARGEGDSSSAGQLRTQANALALRTTQAYLTARKGSGFLRSEPAQRWARQALFFLVWSCPSPIAQAAIRDLAGICPA